MSLVTKPNSRTETILRAVNNTFKPACIILAAFYVAQILGTRTLAEIFPAIIKLVPIFVVYLFSIGTSRYFSVHHKIFSFFRFEYAHAADSSEGIGFLAPKRTPIEFTQPLEILNIYDSGLALRERNQSVRFIKWLGNCVSVNTWFRHESSAKGFVLPSHFITNAT